MHDARQIRTTHLGRRSKIALVVGLVVLSIVFGERLAMASDDTLLRMACAPWPRHSIMWELLGCYELPDDGHSPEGS